MQTVLPANFKQIEEKAFLVRKVLWAALFASLAFYLIIGFFLQSPLTDRPIIDPQGRADLYSKLRLAFICLAAVNLWLAGLIRNKGAARPATPPGARPFQMPDAAWDQMTDEERMRLSGIKKRLTTELAAWALSEAAGLYGFVLFILFGRFNDLLFFIAIAAVGFILNRPQALSRSGIPLSS
jgi:hypothetical protein